MSTTSDPDIVAVIGAGTGVGLLCVQRLLLVTPQTTIIRAVVRSPTKHKQALTQAAAAAAAAGMAAQPLPPPPAAAVAAAATTTGATNSLTTSCSTGGSSGTSRPTTASCDTTTVSCCWLSQRLQVAAGDVTNPSSLAAALAGVSGVIVASGGTTFWSAEHVDNKGVKNVAAAAKASGNVRRVVLVSGMCSHPANRYHPVRVFLNTFIKWRTLEHKFAGEEALAASGVPYTVIRPPFLTNEPAGMYAIKMDVNATKECRFGSGPYTIGRADVAAVCVKALYYPGAAGLRLSVYKERHQMAARRLMEGRDVLENELEQLFDDGLLSPRRTQQQY